MSMPSPITHASIRTAQSMHDKQDWLVQLSGKELEELYQAAAKVCEQGVALQQLQRDDFALPSLAPRLARLRHELLYGGGFLQLRGFDVERADRRHTATAFWGLSLHLADRFASQNKHGHLLGHITDLGESKSNVSQRGPYSRERIPFHVDACDVVGLMCLNPAKRGGESSIASSGLIHNEMLKRRPELLDSLYQPIFRDRRDEIPPGKLPWYAIPIFSSYGGVLSVNVEPTYIGSVARHFSGRDPHSELKLEAMMMMQELADEMHLDVQFEPGDMQFVHNHVIMHSRQHFEDFATASERRHLLRIWLLADDARPLPDAYYGRQGDRQSVRRPGGIFDANTVTNVPLFSTVEQRAGLGE